MENNENKQELPPTLPPLPVLPPQEMLPKTSAARDDYDMIADNIGFVPNIRKQDNIVQGIVILVTMVLGVIIGLIVDFSSVGALLGVLGGLILGTLVSGIVLMIIGLKRKR
jgi:hypothetical protein